ncbi:penicillin-binding protein 1A [Marinobacter sp. TBZ242]|uniref:Penicillin-binding protein 1A n=1 Tax=Marinobacter azerbaijanicus TaxID=3050455 RepID=A0ABT7IGS3_9GAMM|nr:penicillin-binding protein 1A [Marinobacter sp. TBZ242]MDL0433372.1 penicillin-binding protein 1A [Marinobacter sp. TBZ242]
MSHLLRTSRLFAWLFLTGFSLATIVASGFYLYLRPGLPPVEQLLDIKLQTPLRVFSADDKLIAEFGEKRRAPVTIEQIPTIQLHAFLAAEDARFYEHFGVDFKGLMRAAIELVSTGEIQSGGSTITMQVAKNYFLSRDRTFIRKFNEILLALQIERELDKNRILELYLNKIYLGNRAYGIVAAAQVYYDKQVNELSLAEMAMLAGLPKAPSAYNPLADPRRAEVRRNWILSRMRDLEYITQDAYELASSAPLTASFNAPSTEVDADYVAEMARAEMVRRFGDAAYTDGYIVKLTVDSQKQREATLALRRGLEEYDRRHGFRGPIGQVEESELAPDNLKNLMANYPQVAELVPAVVTEVRDEDNEVDLYARKLGKSVMAFNTMTWAKRHKTENLTGPEPERPSDVVAPGDIVYVKPMVIMTPERPAETGESDSGESEDSPRMEIPEIRRVALSQVPKVQGALISLNAKTGAIEALAGGYSFSQNKYNRATQAQRQPGSTFKPFLYLSALEQGMTPATIYNDAPIVFDDSELETTWRPQNSSGQFYGPTRLREALYRSRNLVSVRLLRDLGIQNTIDYLDQLRIPTENMQKDLSLSLGSGLLTPMDLARGFAVIANGGYDVEPYLVNSISDVNDEKLFEAPKVILCDENCEQVQQDIDEEDRNARVARRLADERSVYILHSMMRDVISLGTGRRALALGREDISGKTGTTNEQRDTWFGGFNHDIATTVWVGFDQPQPLGRREFGASTALPVWLDYMEVALEGQPPSLMPRPNGIVNIRIDPETGKRARPGQEGAMFELFREEDAPPPLDTQEESAGGSENGDDGGLSRQIF